VAVYAETAKSICVDERYNLAKSTQAACEFILNAKAKDYSTSIIGSLVGVQS
jgi:hypothetical protein